MTTWETQPAPDGIGLWLTRVEPSRVQALVPPGVNMLEPNIGAPAHCEPCGWRVASWYRWGGSLPLIDYDAPSSVREVSTRVVVSLVAEDLSEAVFQIMIDELATARQFARPDPRHQAHEALARPSAFAADWLEREINDAFPLEHLRLRLSDVCAALPPHHREIPPPHLQPAAAEGGRYPKADEVQHLVGGGRRSHRWRSTGLLRSWTRLNAWRSAKTPKRRSRSGEHPGQDTAEIAALT